jgi:hypothetical protein
MLKWRGHAASRIDGQPLEHVAFAERAETVRLDLERGGMNDHRPGQARPHARRRLAQGAGAVLRQLVNIGQ